jgi:acyl dehydratase
MPGRTFEQWSAGDRIAHDICHTVTAEENRLVTTKTHNAQPLHLDESFAAKSEFGQIVVNGLFTFALMVGISVEDTTSGTLIANLGYDKVTMPKPVFIGDTLRVETEVMDLRVSRSRPNAGIVTFRHRAFNQRNELVCEALRTALVQRGVP